MGSRKLCMVHEVQLATSDMRRLWSLLFLHQSFSSPVELKDDGDGLTGPQPSILGSVDKVFNKVNNFDQYQCLQKMICQFMGGAEDAVVNTVTNNFGSQSGQAAQSSFNQFHTKWTTIFAEWTTVCTKWTTIYSIRTAICSKWTTFCTNTISSNQSVSNPVWSSKSKPVWTTNSICAPNSVCYSKPVCIPKPVWASKPVCASKPVQPTTAIFPSIQQCTW